MNKVESFNILARQLPLKEELFLFLFFPLLPSKSHIETEIALTTPNIEVIFQSFYVSTYV